MELVKASEKKHISPSQLGMYEKCGEQYRRRYIENEKIPPGIAMLKGTGMHGAAKVNWGQKIESHKDLSKKDIIEAGVSTFETAIKKDGFILSASEEVVGAESVVGQAKEGVATLSGLYADEVAGMYQPELVEAKQLVELPGEFNLLGYIDMADVNSYIVDLKSATKKKPIDEADKSEALTFYSLTYQALTKRVPAVLVLEILIDKKVPEVQQLKSSRTVDDYTVLINRINAMCAGLKAGVFIPAQQGSWWCSPRWCGYYRTCKFVKH